MPQGVEGKVSNVGILQQTVIREENFFTRAETPEDIIRILIWYDWEHGYSGCVPIDIVLLFDDFDEVDDF